MTFSEFSYRAENLVAKADGVAFRAEEKAVEAVGDHHQREAAGAGELLVGGDGGTDAGRVNAQHDGNVAGNGTVPALHGLLLQTLQGLGRFTQEHDGTSPGGEALPRGDKVPQSVVGGFLARIQDGDHIEAPAHGGQIRLFGVNLLSLNGVERNYLKGWNLENEIPILTTTGVGCEGVNIRLGSRPEVWLITLRAGEGLPDLR